MWCWKQTGILLTGDMETSSAAASEVDEDGRGGLQGGKSKTPVLRQRQRTVQYIKTNYIDTWSSVSLTSVQGVEHHHPTICTPS